MTQEQTKLFLEDVKKYLTYDQDSGKFYWVKKTSSRSRIKIGGEAGSIEKKGYRNIIFKGKNYKAHRLAWLYVNGRWPVDQIDHINRKKADNRIENLREATNQINHKNKPLQANNTSGYCGIAPRYGGWRVRIGLNGKRVHGGDFKDINSAIEARDALKRKYNFHENHGVNI